MLEQSTHTNFLLQQQKYCENSLNFYQAKSYAAKQKEILLPGLVPQLHKPTVRSLKTSQPKFSGLLIVPKLKVGLLMQLNIRKLRSKNVHGKQESLRKVVHSTEHKVD